MIEKRSFQSNGEKETKEHGKRGVEVLAWSQRGGGQHVAPNATWCRTLNGGDRTPCLGGARILPQLTGRRLSNGRAGGNRVKSREKTQRRRRGKIEFANVGGERTEQSNYYLP